MVSETQTPPPPIPVSDELQGLRDHWALFLILGIGVIIIGLLAISFSFFTTIATVAIFGTFLLLGGAMHLVNAVTGRNWRGFFVHLIIGVLYIVVGMLMLEHPVGAAAGLTLMLAAAFIAGGILRIVVAAIEHFHGWP